jgi:hypothetical protein
MQPKAGNPNVGKLAKIIDNPDPAYFLTAAANLLMVMLLISKSCPRTTGTAFKIRLNL